MRTVLVISLLAVSSTFLYSQVDSASSTEVRPYTFTGQVIGGYVRDLTAFEDTQNDLTVNRDQFSVAGRFLWRPGNLLSGGLEVGYMNFFSVRNDVGGLAVRSAVPMYMVFSMSAWEAVDFSIGYGLGILNSRISGNANSDGVESSTISTAWFLSAGYSHPINDRLNLGGEVRYSNFDKLDDRTLSVSAVVSYRFLEY